jgi:pilus assembly protein Flp/PilA
MKTPFKLRTLTFHQSGQAVVEYALILVLVSIVVLLALSLLGSRVSKNYKSVANSLQAPASTASEVPSTLLILGDMEARILKYFNTNGRWPRSFGPYNFTDIGLNSDDWSKPVNGLYFSPHGSEVGIANKAGDSIEVYAKDLDKNTIHLNNGWSIWCPVNSAGCYYHTVAPGHEVVKSSIYATGY